MTIAGTDGAALDSGPRDARPATERMCAVTRQVRPIAELIRFVVGPDGAVTPDLKRKLPGRGLWVTAHHDRVAEAARRQVFAKGFRRAVKVSPQLADETDALLKRAALDALGIAAKAGLVVAGFAKVEAAIAEGAVAALIEASDGAPDGLRKLQAALRRAGAAETPVLTILASAELDLALARSNVIHAALLKGAAGKTFLSRSQTLVRYRAAHDATATTTEPA